MNSPVARSRGPVRILLPLRGVADVVIACNVLKRMIGEGRPISVAFRG